MADRHQPNGDRRGVRSRGDEEDWPARYFAAWTSNDAEDVASLFAEDAVYFYGPFREPARGREEIVRRWTANGAPHDVTTQHEVVAVNGNVAVIHWRVTLAGGATDGVLIVTFDAHGACVEHREWYIESNSPLPA